MSKKYFTEITEKDVLEILYEPKLFKKLKKPPEQLPLDETAEYLNTCKALCLPLSSEDIKSGIEEDKENSAKIRDLRDYLKQIQKHLLIIRKCFKKINRIVDPIVLCWDTQPLDDKVNYLENCVTSMLELTKISPMKRGRREHENINELMFIFAIVYTEITNEKPTATPDGAFARFALHCLECFIGDKAHYVKLERPIKNVLENPFTWTYLEEMIPRSK